MSNMFCHEFFDSSFLQSFVNFFIVNKGEVIEVVLQGAVR
jgi:hypothetical protein